MSNSAIAFVFGLVTTVVVGCATPAGQRQVGQWDPGKRADVHAQLAAGYMGRDQLEIAREEVEQALAIKPDHSRANYVMAVLQTRLGHPVRAERYYKKALQTDSENSEAAHDYGVFLCRRGRVDDALQYFKQALSNPLYRRHALTNLRAGECLITARTDRRGAEPYFRRALLVNPRLAVALHHMADISFMNKNYLSARGYLERYFSIGEETAKTLLLAVKIEKQLGAHDVAGQYAKQLKSRFASSEEARQLRGIK